jgi:AcrR family transcriptional regulator
MSTKERILEAATALFSRRGFNAVSIRDITGAVGIKESTLYYHFKNKDEIISSILTEYREAYRNMLPPESELGRIISSTSPHDFLKRGLDNYRQQVLEHPRMSQISRILQMEQFGQELARDILLHDVIGGSMRFLEKVFELMMEQGLIRKQSPSQLAHEYQYPVFAMYVEYQLLHFDGKDTSVLEGRLVTHLERFMERIQAQGNDVR